LHLYEKEERRRGEKKKKKSIKSEVVPVLN
jgi:hypothetical protein